MVYEQLISIFKDIFPYIEIDAKDNNYATIILEDYYVPEILKALERPVENKCLLDKFFAFLENLLQNNWLEYNTLIQVTILESLGNDPNILCNALDFMGPITKFLQKKAEDSLGRKMNKNLINNASCVLPKKY